MEFGFYLSQLLAEQLTVHCQWLTPERAQKRAQKTPKFQQGSLNIVHELTTPKRLLLKVTGSSVH